MTKEEALTILPGNPVEWPADEEIPYLLLRKSPDCEKLVIQQIVTGEEFEVPYSEVKRTSVFRAGSLVKSRMKETGDEVIGLTIADIWPKKTGSFLFLSSINMRTGQFLKPTDQVIGIFSLPSQEERRKYCDYMLNHFNETSKK